MSRRKDDFEQTAALVRRGDTIDLPQPMASPRRAYRGHSNTNWSAIIGWALITTSVVVFGVVIATWSKLYPLWITAVIITVGAGVIFVLLRLFYSWANMHQWWRMQKAAADRMVEEVETHRQVRKAGIRQAEAGLATFSFQDLRVEPIPVATQKATGVPLLEAGEEQPSFLDLLQTSERIALVGGSGTGKTNKMRQKVAYSLHQNHRCIVLDTDSDPATWPGGSEVRGSGLQWDEVRDGLDDIKRLIEDRYDQLRRGIAVEGQFEPVLLAADEWTMLPEEIPGIQPTLKFILTKARKVNVMFILGVHAFTVKSLGLEGEGALRMCFTHVAWCYGENGQNLSVKAVSTVHSYQEKDAIPYVIEPYLPPGQGGIVNGQVITPEPPPAKSKKQIMAERFKALPAEEKRLILLTHKQGLSLNAAFKELGRRSGYKNYQWADGVYAKVGLKRPADARKKNSSYHSYCSRLPERIPVAGSENSTNGTNNKNCLTKKGKRMFKRGRFKLGQTVATPGALEALREAGQEAATFLARHQAGDWGEVPPEDAAENELSVREGFRIISSYTLNSGVKIWVITEADRNATTILLPSEY